MTSRPDTVAMRWAYDRIDVHALCDYAEALEARVKELERVAAHARAMSDALLKVRPLGGSELFVMIDGVAYADPKFCGDAIEELASSRHRALCDRSQISKDLSASQAQCERLRAALKAASGYLLNARIDLETGAPKRTAIQTIDGGLTVVRAALKENEHG